MTHLKFVTEMNHFLITSQLDTNQQFCFINCMDLWNKIPSFHLCFITFEQRCWYSRCGFFQSKRRRGTFQMSEYKNRTLSLFFFFWFWSVFPIKWIMSPLTFIQFLSLLGLFLQFVTFTFLFVTLLKLYFFH